MSDKICPIILAGFIANKSFNNNELKNQADCIGGDCAWWDPKYNLCFVEMIALR